MNDAQIIPDKLWYRTNLDVSDIYKDGLDLREYLLSDRAKPHNTMFVEGAGGIWNIPAHEIFKPEAIQKFHDEFDGLKFATVNCFMRWPNYQHPDAHHDCYEYDGKVIHHGGALNWTWEPDVADMVWYEWPEDVEPVMEKRNNIEMNVSVPIPGLKEVGRVRVGQTPTLVNTAVLHTVEMGSVERIVLSCRFEWVVTWEEHLHRFERILVDE